MQARVLLTVALTLVLAGMFCVAPAGADEAVVPFVTTFQTHPQIVGQADNCLVVEIPGEGQMMHLGDATWYADMWACFDGSQTGVMEFTAANGDQLFGFFEGTWAGMPPAPVTFQGTFWITGGTGRFEGATATGTYVGSAEGTEGILTFDGMLTK
jgi:hypothetical protein